MMRLIVHLTPNAAITKIEGWGVNTDGHKDQGAYLFSSLSIYGTLKSEESTLFSHQPPAKVTKPAKGE